jgi:hypothetical protein
MGPISGPPSVPVHPTIPRARARARALSRFPARTGPNQYSGGLIRCFTWELLDR